MFRIKRKKEELIIELQKLEQENLSLKFSYDNVVAATRQEGILLQQTHQNHENFFNTINDFLFVLDEQENINHTN